MAKDNSALNLMKLQLESEFPTFAKAKKKDKYVPEDDEKKRAVEDDETWKIAINFRSYADGFFQEYIDRHEAKPFFYEDGRAGVVLPLGKAIIETAQAQESKNPPSFAYSPKEFKEDEAKARILETVVTKHVWYQKYVSLDQKFDIMNQDKMILGTMYQYVGYRRMFRVNRKFKKGTKPSEGKFDLSEELFYDDLVVENVYPQDVWLHPLATCVEESPWCFIRKRFDYATFLETYSDFDFYKNVNFVEKGKWVDSTSNGGITRKKISYNQQDEVVVIEKWDKMKDAVTIRANGIEIYYGPNPFDHKEIPLTDYRNRLQHNTYLGESELERIATLSDTICAFINIAVDKEKRASSGINLADNELGDYDDTANIFDSTTLTRVENPGQAFVHYDLPGMSASTDKIIQMLLDFLVFSTGIDFRQITDLSSSTKATVAALRREISQQRIQLNVRRNENCGIKRLGWLIAKCVQQFYPIPKIEEITNEKTGKKEQKKTYRTIRVEGMDMEEAPDKDGVYSENSLKIKSRQDSTASFFQARPEYLRLKGDICVTVIPGSTLSAIRELEKSKAQEYVKTATEVLEPGATPEEAPKPILSVRYGLEKLVQAYGYDLQRAFDTSDKKLETPAQDEGKDVIEQMNAALGGAVGSGSKTQGIVTKNGGVSSPANPGPPSLVGAKSEPVREMANELGVNNRVTNKKM